MTSERDAAPGYGPLRSDKPGAKRDLAIEAGFGATTPDAATTRLWSMTMEVSFEADNPEDASAIASRLTQRVLEHPAAWSVDGEFDPAQRTEVVDV